MPIMHFDCQSCSIVLESRPTPWYFSGSWPGKLLLNPLSKLLTLEGLCGPVDLAQHARFDINFLAAYLAPF